MIRHSTTELVKIKAAAIGFVLVVFLTAVVGVRPAGASTTFTVNSVGDAADLNLKDSVCDTDFRPLVVKCTLRAAIQEANDTFGKDTINFAIPDDGPHTISVDATKNGNLPFLTDPVLIDGYSQGSATATTSDDASPNTLEQGDNAVLKIELTNPAELATFGLVIETSNSAVRGLVINNFSNDIRIQGDGANGNRIEGNLVGTGISGETGAANGSGGMFVLGDDNIIGGATPAARNVISGNSGFGIQLGVLAGGNKVQGNFIGTNKSGTSPLGNSGGGVLIQAGDDNTIGGTSSAASNTIATNGGDGVTMSAFSTIITGEPDDFALHNRVLCNSIFANDDLGIDLGDTDGFTQGDGPTPNDLKDSDQGPNGLQNFPVLTSATRSASGTTVKGHLNSKPNKTFTARFFSNLAGADEGETFLGQKILTTDDLGNANFTFSTPSTVRADRNVTATATDAVGNTSEFSAPEAVVRQ